MKKYMFSKLNFVDLLEQYTILQMEHIILVVLEMNIIIFNHLKLLIGGIEQHKGVNNITLLSKTTD